jgi:hypothetical protein
MCANAGCPNDAKIKGRRRRVNRMPDRTNPIHVAHGAWLNMCHACDDALRRKENQEYCAAMGLDTPAKQRVWCLDQLKRPDRIMQHSLREPGQDEGEMPT